jgi:hypothetical protein
MLISFLIISESFIEESASAILPADVDGSLDRSLWLPKVAEIS